MVKQLDIYNIDLSPTAAREKKKYRPCIVVSNEIVNRTGFAWVMPITKREERYSTDISITTEMKRVTGIIDGMQIRCVDLTGRQHNFIDRATQDVYTEVRDVFEALTQEL